MKRVRYTCAECGGSNILWDAWAEWDVDKQEMVLRTIFDYCECEDCNDETSVNEEVIDE